jgi:phosphatidylinositol-3-phosphatase
MRYHWINSFVVLFVALVLLAGTLQSSASSSLAASSLQTSTARSSTSGATTQPVAVSGTVHRPTDPFSLYLPLALKVPGIKTTVFVIMMENHNWSAIYNSSSAPYINNTLLPMASYALQYYNPTGIHPSEPNYLWLEAGTNFGIANDADPAQNHQSTTAHLVTLLSQASISWKSYQEDIPGTNCPLSGIGLYAPKHNPMVYFDDITNTNDPTSATCIAHVRPYTELATDIQNNTVPQYAFITPNLCNDMHGAAPCASADQVSLGDTWLSNAVPQILASQAYLNNGILLITWDEGTGGDGPVGMIVLSPLAVGGGYTNTVHYTHSSTLRTLQEIFGVTPLLGDAAQSNDLSDLFTRLP